MDPAGGQQSVTAYRDAHGGACMFEHFKVKQRRYKLSLPSLKDIGPCECKKRGCNCKDGIVLMHVLVDI